MKIKISLSTESIHDALVTIRNAKLNLEDGISEFISILTNEGAEKAQVAYGEWGVQATPIAEETQGTIIVSGDMPLIAEFGAGDATLEPGQYFENEPSTEVFKGSYSLYVGSRQYWDSHLKGQGRWYFAGEEYTEVKPRQGLYKAKTYIIEEAKNVAQEVIQL